jgi:hypothetical protein
MASYNIGLSSACDIKKQAYVRDIFKEASKSICTSTVVVYPDSLSPTPSISSAMKLQNAEENPDDPEPGDGDSLKEHSSD